MKKTLLSLVILVAIAGCSRKQHLTATFARSYDDAFRAQASRGGAPQGPILGLDSQEAAIVSDTYRASLAPKGAQASNQPVLIVAPQGERGMLPPPSVPR